MQGNPFLPGSNPQPHFLLTRDEANSRYVLKYSGLEIYFTQRSEAERYIQRLQQPSAISFQDDPFNH